MNMVYLYLMFFTLVLSTMVMLTRGACSGMTQMTLNLQMTNFYFDFLSKKCTQSKV